MDDNASIQSDLLQNRLREKKAESARNDFRHRQTSSIDTTARRVAPGRDDNIFDPDLSPQRRPAARAFQSSPTAASSRADTRTTSSGRRTSGMAGNAAATPRAMGARELEGHVDKLSKENFSLKMEVYHQREKNEKLEKRVKELQDFGDQNAELQSLNEDLYTELENRDRAIDEAVVMITDLEQRIRELEEERSSTRPSTAQFDKSSKSRTATSDSHSVSPPKRPRQPNTPKECTRRPSVSQQTSARMAELSTPTKDDNVDRPKLLPSFLLDHQPSTGTLRSQFVQENKTIRPVPSHASLISKRTDREDEEDVPRSPGLSVLSERDFASVYGHEVEAETPTEQPAYDELVDGTRQDVSSSPVEDDEAELSKAQKMARTDRWVSDAANSASKSQTSIRSFGTSSANFQSIGGVLQQDNHVPELESPTKQRRKQPLALRKELPKHTPPIPAQPLFGQHVFPPTPDTMTTRPLNRSTSSINPDRVATDSLLDPNRFLSSQIQSSQGQIGSQSSSKRNSMLPREFDAYGDSDSSAGVEDDTANKIANDFGQSLFRSHGSDSFSMYETPMSTRYHSAREGSVVSGSDGLTDAPPRSSPSPPRVFSSRRLSVDNTPGNYVTPPTHLLRTNTEPPGAMAPISPIGKAVFDAPQDRRDAPPLSLTFATPPARDARAHRRPDVGPHILLKPPPEPSSPPSSAKPPLTNASNRPPQRTASLRQRMTRLARRTSASTPTNVKKHIGEEAIGTPTTSSGPPSASGHRSSSITRNFFRRRSASRGESANAATDSDDPASRSSAGATSAFLHAATRAAPFLSFGSNNTPSRHEEAQSPLTLANGHQRLRRATSTATDLNDIRPYTAVPASSGSLHNNDSPSRDLGSGMSSVSSHGHAASSSIALGRGEVRPSAKGRRESTGSSVPPTSTQATERSRSRSKTKTRRDSWTLPQIDATGAGARF